MFIAKDKNGNIVTIEEAINDNGEYFCPTCGATLRIDSKESDKRRTHFKHIKKCLDDWKYEMSEWHYNWQCLFPKECREVVMDNGVETHRADVFINNTVIEFQHSNITRDDFTARNKFYTSLGYNVVWVFDANGKLKDGNKIFAPLSWGEIWCLNDHYEREIEWRRRNSVFENFEDCGGKIAILLETETNDCTEKVLLPIKKFLWDAAKEFKIYYTIEYITQDNFLKEYGVLKNSDALSIKEIFEQTAKMQEQLPKPQEAKQRKITMNDILKMNSRYNGRRRF